MIILEADLLRLHLIPAIACYLQPFRSTLNTPCPRRHSQLALFSLRFFIIDNNCQPLLNTILKHALDILPCFYGLSSDACDTCNHSLLHLSTTMHHRQCHNVALPPTSRYKSIRLPTDPIPATKFTVVPI
ncbi:hypothetical protein P153DRAFT_145433 [Dothidotthia symphoricarpi CBS 119687]|uniref:C2H2-type domain-containing protein n=1 Tax=Dothidotthia symphoricarpi CBS 119687 TaxID=1392245 RepID=A0A6A5ZY86_9PLEO|nr:uncharacterized protein P153DRAFT_145433 [Dothidotthia symphoricarpi CBS 119687]KAF2123747.1 hypothetical protein P153DRAFT_145433 [Dothidotthia symphoricarpi CBS 119687]